MIKVSGFSYLAIFSTLLCQGCLSPNGNFSPWSGTSQPVNLEVPVEMLDVPIGSGAASGTVQDFNSTLTQIDPNAYDGSVQYYFEIVAENIGPSPLTVHLRDPGGEITTIPIASGVSIPTRFRTQFSGPGSPDTYHVALDISPGASYLQVFAARIIIQQTNATKTRLYIPLTSSSASAAPFIADSPPSTTSTYSGYMVGSGGTYSLWTNNLKEAYGALASGASLAFQAVLGTNPGFTASASLLDESTSQTVQASAASTSATVSSPPALATAPFPSDVPNFVDGDVFAVQLKTSAAGGSASLYRAGLWIALNPITKGEAYHRVLTSYQNSTAGSVSYQPIHLDTSVYSNPSVYFEASGYAPSSTATAALFDSDTNQDIANSTLSFGVPASVLRSPELSITSGDDYLVDFAQPFASSDIEYASFAVVSFHP